MFCLAVFACVAYFAYHLRAAHSVWANNPLQRRDGTVGTDEAAQGFCKSGLASHLADGSPKLSDKVRLESASSAMISASASAGLLQTNQRLDSTVEVAV
ncbi:hypothetical protein CHU98_g911 [Xylaria longipes]|nr:hypothetical protein CHU98_g911 [Xylaria longipes]